MEDCITAELAKVKNRKLISIVFQHISSRDDLNATVKKIVADHEIENENENDNENDVSLQRYGDVSSKTRKKAVKHKYGEYSNVLLTDDELSKLRSEYPDWNERIERLSAYIASKGTKYKSHYATIRNWARKEGAVSVGQATGNSSKVRIGNYI